MYAVNLNDSQRCPYAALGELIRQAINEGADRFTDFQEDEQLTLRLQKNPPCVRVDDYSAIPAAYQQEVITVQLLKTEISKALQAGQQIPGVHLQHSTRLVIT